MLIGKLALSSGVSRDTIRYYEKVGLIQLGKDDRRDNHYKEYPPEALQRLTQIGQLKKLGFTLAEMKELFEALAIDASVCNALPEQLDQKLDELQRKISLLENYKQKLIAVRDACSPGCGTKNGLPSCFTHDGG